jgi:hypothetical protein
MRKGAHITISTLPLQPADDRLTARSI